MNKLILVAALGFMTACASTTEIPSKQAVDDFVAVSELQETGDIRHFGTLQHTYLNDHYVLVTTRKEEFLVEFVRRCHELRDNYQITPDIRRESNTIRAKFDTIRGCRIKAIYAINKGQAEEIRSLGDAPGETLDIETAPFEEKKD